MAGPHREVLIVGASAAGLRCACRLARLQPDWRVRVLEAELGDAGTAAGDLLTALPRVIKRIKEG